MRANSALLVGLPSESRGPAHRNGFPRMGPHHNFAFSYYACRLVNYKGGATIPIGNSKGEWIGTDNRHRPADRGDGGWCVGEAKTDKPVFRQPFNMISNLDGTGHQAPAIRKYESMWHSQPCTSSRPSFRLRNIPKYILAVSMGWKRALQGVLLCQSLWLSHLQEKQSDDASGLVYGHLRRNHRDDWRRNAADIWHLPGAYYHRFGYWPRLFRPRHRRPGTSLRGIATSRRITRGSLWLNSNHRRRYRPLRPRPLVDKLQHNTDRFVPLSRPAGWLGIERSHSGLGLGRSWQGCAQ